MDIAEELKIRLSFYISLHEHQGIDAFEKLLSSVKNWSDSMSLLWFESGVWNF